MSTSGIAVGIVIGLGAAGFAAWQATPSAPGANPAGQASPATQTTAPASQAAPAKKPLPPDVLDSLLAPVALYPDQLLTQMLLCTSDPPKIQELSGWLVRNAELTGTALQTAAEKAGFEPSFVILTLVPQVVNYMADNIAWTRALGNAFTSDRTGVLDSVQRLRASAQTKGTLKSTPEQTVETKQTSSGGEAIVIEPANPQVVYVPQYNPQVVYATPPATTTTIVTTENDDDEAAAAALGAMVGFTAGIAIGAAVNNNYYHGPYGWYGGGYMYNDAWDDFYDDREDAREDFYEHREDAREDWQDHREDVGGDRAERASEAREQRTANGTTAQQRRAEGSGTGTTQARTEQQQARQASRAEGQAQRQAQGTTPSATTASAESRGRSSADRQAAASQRSSSRSSDAFSGYSSGSSSRASSSRGSRSRSGGGRSGGGGRRR